MSTTVQNIIDATQANFTDGAADTARTTFLLNAFNQQILPTVRNEILRVDENYFNEIGYTDIVANTQYYKPEKDRDKVTYTVGTPPVDTPRNIRKLHALKVLRRDQDQFYVPLWNARAQRDSTVQVDNSNTFGVWGYLFEGKEVRLLDIPDEARTNGLQWDYTPEFTALAVGDDIPGITDDYIGVLINGLSLKLAEKLRSNTQIKVYDREFLLGRRDLIRHTAQRNDINVQLRASF